MADKQEFAVADVDERLGWWECKPCNEWKGFRTYREATISASTHNRIEHKQE